MHIEYDVDRLRSIVDNLCTLTGLSMAVLDTDGQPLYTRTKGRGDVFCHSIQRMYGQEACLCSDRELLCKCVQSGKAESHLCHAGILDTAVPIMKDGIPAAYILIGRVRPTRLARDNARLQALPASMRREYSSLSCLTHDQLDALLALLPQILFDSAIRLRHDDLMERVTAYVETHLAEDLTVDALCKAMYVSKNTLYAGFRSLYGCTVGAYITARRMETACRLLEDTDRSAQDVARSLGFDNYSYFSKLFKKQTGMSPAEYRRHA